MSSNIAIGIDLGTTFCCVALCQDGDTNVIENNDGNYTTPSAIIIQQDKILVGSQARSLMFPENVFYDSKRMIGQQFSSEAVQRNKKYWTFNIERSVDDIPLYVPYVPPKNESDPGKYLTARYRAEQVGAKILAQLKADAERKTRSQKIREAVITVPAYFNNQQRRATMDAARIAGLTVLQLLNEPTAAALAYQLNRQFPKQEQTLLVFDLGGGTFDVSLVHINGNIIRVLGTEGDTNLGGQDFTNNLMDYVMEQVKEQLDVDLNNKDKNRIRAACDEAKTSLSFQPEFSLALNVKGQDFESQITRFIFESVNIHLFQKCIDIVSKLLKSKNLEPSQVGEIILAGGSSRIPKVKQLLTAFFGGRTLREEINPDEAIARGAAHYAELLSKARRSGADAQGQRTHMDATQDVGSGYIQNQTGSNGLSTASVPPGTSSVKDEDETLKSRPSQQGAKLHDCTPLSYGVEMSNSMMSVIVPKDTPIPCSRKKLYCTIEDNQQLFTIKVYEGEKKLTKDNVYLGQFYLTGIPPGPRGSQRVEISFDIDTNSTLNVTATLQGTTHAETMQIFEEEGRLTEQDVDDLRSQAVAEQARTMAAKARLQFKRNLETARRQVQNDYRDVISEYIYNQAMKSIQGWSNYVEQNESGSQKQFEVEIGRLNAMMQKLSLRVRK